MAFQVSWAEPVESVSGCSIGGGTTVTANDLTSLRFGAVVWVTRTVIVFVVLAEAAVVGQERTPVAESIVAPVGAPGSRLNASACGGTAGSVAELVTTSTHPAWRVRSAGGASVGP